MNTSTDGGKFAVFYQQLDASFGSHNYRSIYQDITGFSPDTDYVVRFEMANMFIGYESSDGALVARPGHFDVSLSNTIQGTISTAILDYPLPPDTTSSVIGPWSEITMTFRTDSTVAADTVLQLRFDAFTGDGVEYTPGQGHGGQLTLDGVSISPSVVPEPGSGLLVLTALGLIATRRRRRKTSGSQAE